MRILFIGDIVGRPGRELVRRGVSGLVGVHDADLQDSFLVRCAELTGQELSVP